jgi:hypothetical protein
MIITYGQIRHAMSGKYYPMTLVGKDARVVTKAVNMGIDAHLEACFVPERGDLYTQVGHRLKCSVSPDSLPVLLRRLTENLEYNENDADCDAEHGESLASSILDTLGISNDIGCFSIVPEYDMKKSRLYDLGIGTMFILEDNPTVAFEYRGAGRVEGHIVIEPDECECDDDEDMIHLCMLDLVDFLPGNPEVIVLETHHDHAQSGS